MNSILDQTTDNQDDDGELIVDITLYPDDGPEKVIRQLGCGFSPFLLVEPEWDEETDETKWKITGSWVEDFDELIGLMESALDVVRAAVEQNKARPGGDV